MSALPSAPPSTSTPPPPTATPSGPVSNTSSLLFGFLVSALSVFAVLMTVAIIWNRLVARRRAIDAATLTTSPPLHPQWLRQPTMWDIWVVPDTQVPPWVDFKPLAVQRHNYPASSPRAMQTARTTSFWRHRLRDCLPPEITYLFRQPMPESSSDTDTPQVEPSHGSDTQISLLICMPRAPLAKREQMFHEMVFATTNIVYHDPGPS